ncbi:hypothetical protein ONA91_03040 [Micromonospora sp. DR5-3]|uniref:hypothetical protein n=1 Tax=unclassified Micromonospora TaxID=2617518 RepID=UPI0011DB6283|nr:MULTISPECIES: hypothetical protein [unclassified Micromonospora]MCW3813435.1 hypothetical protein [Micromonospora sp. DR5-3]TYC24893.1 hypothetical protein FXF52_08270 [Micromonospora sp. MP36]
MTNPPPSHQHRPRVDLPDWMRNPEPPRRTLGRRLSEFVDGVPALRAARHRLWAWRDRSRFSERHPVVSAIVSFVVVAVVATCLVVGTLYLFYKISHREL